MEQEKCKARVRAIAVAVLLLGSLASSQAPNVQVQIDNNGAVIAAQQQIHVKNGQVVQWSRQTAGGTWFVRFARSPCANGVTEFGSAAPRPQTCRIAVTCIKNGDASCSYHYASSLTPTGTMHDPDVIVDN